MTLIEMAVLKYIAEKCQKSEKPVRAQLEPMGLRVHMWQRTDDNLYADCNHMWGWHELEVIDHGLIDMVFEHLNFYIDNRVHARRKQIREAQNNGD